MSEGEPVVRTMITIDNGRYELMAADGVLDLRRSIEAAVATGGRFVDFITTGGRPVAVLVTSDSRIVITTVTDVTASEEEDVRFPAGLHLLEEF